eukprot:10694125-Alexandrium_andersonii.AAC.1
MLWRPTPQEQRIARIAVWRIACWSLRFRDFAAWDSLGPCGRWRIRNLCQKLCRAHPSRASVAKFEAVPGPAQFKLRTPDAIL